MRGSNHSGMRQFNERIVLQAIRHHRAIAKADLARVTQLSTQTISVIVNRLLEDGLLIKQDRVRGRIGQPSVPLSLDPEGVFSVGLQVGRRSLEVLVCDFVGHTRHSQQFHYPYPDPDVVLANIRTALADMQSALGEHWSRTVGIGLTAPLSMHQWAHLMGGDAAPALQRWADFDLPAAVQALTEVPVSFAKDTVAACVAELVQGHGRAVGNYLYVFVGTFIGGALVLGGHIISGARQNAGALGSIPTGLAMPGSDPMQLLQLASGWQLEQALQAAGHDPNIVQQDHIMGPLFKEHTEVWLSQASEALAMSITTASALLDIDAVVIDGSLGSPLMAALIETTRANLAHYPSQGLHTPVVLPGKVGAHARAIGGALLPLHTQFFPDKDIFLKQDLV
ncbi:MAG: putative fructokinase [Pseudomonadota bacterium]